MKKIIFIIIFIVFINQNGYSQKILKDKNTSYLYNYILDSIYKIYTYKDFNGKIRISNKTIEHQILKDIDVTMINTKRTCIETIFLYLKDKYNVDSSEMYFLTNNVKIISKKLFDQKYYDISEDKSANIFFTEPIYFKHKKFIIIGAMNFNEQFGLFLFLKNKNKWIYIKSFCEVTY